MAPNELTQRITDLLSFVSSPAEEGVIPIAHRGDTKKITISDLRNLILIDNGYIDVASGLAATESGEVFYVFTDTNQRMANGYRNAGSNTATPILGTDGNAIIVLTKQGLYDLLAIFSSLGYDLIGGFFSGEGEETVGNGTGSVFDRVTQRGQYDIVQGPNDPKGVVGMTFGGPANKGSLVLDERGRIQTYVIKDDQPTAARVAVPYSELFGQGPAGTAWDGAILHVPYPGGEDDTLHSSLVFMPRTDGGVDVYTRGPGGYGNFDVPYPSAKTVMARIATANDFAPAMLKCSVNFTTNVSATTWSPLFQVRTDQTGPTFVGVYMGGNVLANAVYPYLITCTNIASAPTAATIKDVIRITALRDRGDTPYSTGDNLTQFGWVYDSTANTLTVYSRDGARSDEATFFPWRYQSTTSAGVPRVTVYQNSDSYLTTEPTGIAYLDIAESLSSNTSVELNNGTLVKTTGAVLRLTNSIAASTKTPVRGLFKQNDTYSAINRGYAGLGTITTTRTTTGTYQITGISAGGNSVGWKIYSPMKSGGSGLQELVATITSDTGSAMTIEVRTIAYTNNSSTNVVTRSAGALTDIPVDSWVDIHTTLR